MTHVTSHIAGKTRRGAPRTRPAARRDGLDPVTTSSARGFRGERAGAAARRGRRGSARRRGWRRAERDDEIFAAARSGETAVMSWPKNTERPAPQERDERVFEHPEPAVQLVAERPQIGEGRVGGDGADADSSSAAASSATAPPSERPKTPTSPKPRAARKSIARRRVAALPKADRRRASAARAEVSLVEQEDGEARRQRRGDREQVRLLGRIAVEQHEGRRAGPGRQPSRRAARRRQAVIVTTSTARRNSVWSGAGWRSAAGARRARSSRGSAARSRRRGRPPPTRDLHGV